MSRERPNFGPRQIRAVEELAAKRHYLLVDLFGRLTCKLVRLQSQPVKRGEKWFAAISEAAGTPACGRVLSLDDYSVCPDSEGEWNDAQCLMAVSELALPLLGDAAKLLSESERAHLGRLVIPVETISEEDVEIDVDFQQL